MATINRSVLIVDDESHIIDGIKRQLHNGSITSLLIKSS